MKKFRTVTYEIHSPKICSRDGVRFALLADLHGLEFGKEGRCLLEEIRKSHPKAVLAAGDMIVRKKKESLDVAQKLLLGLARDYPVYYALGNHECKMNAEGNELRGDYLDYEKRLSAGGIRFLHNQRASFEVGPDRFSVYGLELPMEYYHKPTSPKLTAAAVRKLIGSPKPEEVNILLAHNPKYGNAYFSWAADLTVSGHYHGGIVRFNRHTGLTCPQFLLFPPYCCGDFRQGNRHMVVSAGLGEHTIPVRIHNPRELVIIDMKPGP